jgi:hydrogenase-4 component B
MSAANAILMALIVCAVGAAVTLVASRSKAAAGWLAFLTTALASALALYAAGTTLMSGPGEALTLWTLPQFGSALRLAVDGLSAVFVSLIAVISLLAALYSIRYMEHYPEYGVSRYYPYFLLFVAGMYGIVCLTDLMLFFFLFWQLMTLTSYALVRYEYRKPENVRAAHRYLIMMQIAGGLIMLGAGLLAQDPVSLGTNERLMRYDFDAISHGLPALLQQGGGLVTLALLCFLLGFGIKAGMWPFGQMWLPDAHPAAPSPVSALLSGVMIKTGIYGLIRSFLWLIPPAAAAQYPSNRWGFLIASLGTITLFVGTMQALRQEQTKRVLAFSSIGQVGYILLGIGACLALLGPGMRDVTVMPLAAVAFYGALFHTLNHGTFKSLLFLNAGSMLYATGTQDLNRLGGLMKVMPLTAVTTLIASFSIAGVPLFNGFASKWSLYVAAILGSNHARYLPLFAVVAILTSAITLALFLKFFGVSFLSRTSTLVTHRTERREPVEVGWMMQLPQVVLAALCVLVGLLPFSAFWLIHRALVGSQQGLGIVLAKIPLQEVAGLTGINGLVGGAVFMPIALLLLFVGLLGLARWVSRLGRAERRGAEPWLCGYAQEADQNRYGAHNLYYDFMRHFRWVGGLPRPRHEVGSSTGSTSRDA